MITTQLFQVFIFLIFFLSREKIDCALVNWSLTFLFFKEYCTKKIKKFWKSESLVNSVVLIRSRESEKIEILICGGGDVYLAPKSSNKTCYQHYLLCLGTAAHDKLRRLLLDKTLLGDTRNCHLMHKRVVSRGSMLLLTTGIQRWSPFPG